MSDSVQVARIRLRQSLAINLAGSILGLYMLWDVAPRWAGLPFALTILLHSTLFVESMVRKGLSATQYQERWEWDNLPQLVLLLFFCFFAFPQKTFYICSLFSVIGIIYNATTIKSRFYSIQIAAFIAATFAVSAWLLRGQGHFVEIGIFATFTVSSLIVMRETLRVVKEVRAHRELTGQLRIQVDAIKIANRLTVHDLRNELIHIQLTAARLKQKADPSSQAMAESLDRTLAECSATMRLLDVEQRSPFDLRKAVLHVASISLPGLVTVEESVSGRLDYFFLIFTSHLKNLFDNCREAQLRRSGQADGLKVRVWMEKRCLFIEDNAGGLPFPIEELGRHSSKDQGTRRTFLGILSDEGPATGCVVTFANTGAGLRVALDFGSWLSVGGENSDQARGASTGNSASA